MHSSPGTSRGSQARPGVRRAVRRRCSATPSRRHTAPVVSDASAQDGAFQAAVGGLASSLADFVICSGAEVGLTTAIFPLADPGGPGHEVRINAELLKHLAENGNASLSPRRLDTPYQRMHTYLGIHRDLDPSKLCGCCISHAGQMVYPSLPGSGANS